ncbi:MULTISPECIES: thioredoxin domain-containing protein [Lactobacillaceae]|uniref:thioredoxin domain-containing protein n=1 Tax=Lactobacillaceae TaxID=33958 RepID=UPI000AE2DDB3|nr:thioredoxin domain-containing protein [Levilactobacillus brevis]
MSTIDKTLTLINFENNWCAQCYTQRPIINKISHDFNSYLNVRVVNSDAHPELAKNTMFIPHPVLFCCVMEKSLKKLPVLLINHN